MSLLHILIDGYNVLHASAGTDHDWTHLSLEEARNAILVFLSGAIHARQEKVTVVFDGSGRIDDFPRTRNLRGIEVVFSEPGVTADEVICQIVSAAPNPRSVLVVSADREIRRHALNHGAKVIAPDTFLASSQRRRERRRRQGEREPPEKFRGVNGGDVQRWKRILGFDDESQP
ncbi:MAG: NYN domain-containing protein [Planctomycetota bacterium]|jgi:predicted RNA-binding protein with PIN domain